MDGKYAKLFYAAEESGMESFPFITRTVTHRQKKPLDLLLYFLRTALRNLR